MYTYLLTNTNSSINSGWAWANQMLRITACSVYKEERRRLSKVVEYSTKVCSKNRKNGNTRTLGYGNLQEHICISRIKIVDSASWNPFQKFWLYLTCFEIHCLLARLSDAFNKNFKKKALKWTTNKLNASENIAVVFRFYKEFHTINL